MTDGEVVLEASLYAVDPAVAAAIVAALAELVDPKKDQTARVEMKGGGSYSYSYADLADVMAGVRPVLAKHGLAVMQPVDAGGGSVTVTTRLLHRSGGFYESPGFTLPASGSAQVIGSAVTYARRYSLLATLGLATADDDGAAASTRPAEEPAPPPPPEEPPTVRKIDPVTRRVMAKFDAHGMTDKATRMAFVSATLDDEVASWNDVKMADRRRVEFALDRLDEVDDDDQRQTGEVVASLLDGEPS